MADLKIMLELNLTEVYALWALIQNTRSLTKEISQNSNHVLTGWKNAQELNLMKLEEVNREIEPLAE